ncbi:hypothetical protein Xen7305DRAFT_00024180 [Xenococcus sp. PCC 7305]|uniref:hypothetical protein n=1 Tax=Xenococcus sp. PCC 7305 TaxID=102125 RepID=UPI0002AC3CCB|nr:hypothetical protein [Xenococcus sp. PCC 7305]ELS02700.1 hypothetical protein Xen7305DRAFT_00024180 [Xenococcus sp. PCC 7305]
MTRSYSSLSNHQTKILLAKLADLNTSEKAYQEAMMNLGLEFGSAIFKRIASSESTIHLACTVEDADFLAKGILNPLEHNNCKVSFSCFWNKRFSPFEEQGLKVAPILRQYQEPLANKRVQYLIVVKSIISGACVVRTNLTNLIQDIEPEKIFIVAPVLYKGAPEKLKSSFDKSIYDKFEFFYFAEDDVRDERGIVEPGIGGDVYQRLGFKDQDHKNKYIPNIVRERRKRQMVSVAY